MSGGQSNNVDKLMTNLSKIWPKDSNLYKKLVLNLAAEYEKLITFNPTAISWASQNKAQNYFNKHGFVKTLDYMLVLKKTREKKA